MNRKPIDPRIEVSPSEADEIEQVSAREFREALSYWASGVTVVAVRDDDHVQATTVSSLTSISDRPPTVAVSLNGAARILPFLTPGTRYGVSILKRDQRRIASVHADSYPVGPSPFGAGEVPLVQDALTGLVCRVAEVVPVSGSFLVIGTVEEVHPGSGEDPLLYFRRAYRGLEPDG